MTACVHRYRLPPPDGPTALGVCQSCGARRLFKTYYSVPDFLTSQGRRKAKKAAAAALRPAQKGEAQCPQQTGRAL